MAKLAELLELTKPLVLVDLETTGGSASKNRIVQIGLEKIYPDGRENPWMTLVKPGTPIPPDMTEIHGITDEMVSDAPTFEQVAPILHKGLEGCCVGGYNVHFDLNFLDHAFYRIGYPFDPDDFEILDAFDIFKHHFPRNLTAAYKYYVGKELNAAHRADVDIGATREVLEAQLEQHKELPRTVKEIQDIVQKKMEGRVDKQGKFIWSEDGTAIINFGKHEGKRIDQLPNNYLKWVAYEAEDFAPKVRRIAISAMNGQYPVRKD